MRGCPLNPLDWLRTLYMQIAVRSFGISVAALVARAKPGDFLGMSGRGVFAAGQELFTNSRISHVGVVCVSRDVKCIAHATPHADHLPNHNVGGGAGRITPLRAGLREPPVLAHDPVAHPHGALLKQARMRI